MRPPGQPIEPVRHKTFGWYRVYNGFVGHPKWRLIANLCGMTVCEASMIAVALFEAANKAKPRGRIDDFDALQTAAALDIAPEKVALAYQKLEELGWINSGYLVTWDERQPDRKPDATGAERAQRCRNKKKEARERLLIGAPAMTPQQQGKWLMEHGLNKVSTAARKSSLKAQALIIGWLRQLDNDGEALGNFIREAEGSFLSGPAFEARIDALVAQRASEKNRPRLPLGPVVVAGGKS